MPKITIEDPRDKQQNNDDFQQGDLFEWIGCNLKHNPVMLVYRRLVSLKTGSTWNKCAAGSIKKFVNAEISVRKLRRLPPGYKITLEQE
jgi:hypothetical protein